MSSLEQKPLGSAVDSKQAESFDAKGKARMSREMPDGSIIWASEEEYAEEVQAFNKERNS